MAQGYRGLEPEAVPYGLHLVYPRALSVNTAHTRTNTDMRALMFQLKALSRKWADIRS